MWCVLDDWKPDLMAAPWCAYLPGSVTPLMWTKIGPRSAPLNAVIADTWEYVALAAHWATDHPDQLRAFVGEFEMHHGMTRHPDAVSPKA